MSTTPSDSSAQYRFLVPSLALSTRSGKDPLRPALEGATRAQCATRACECSAECVPRSTATHGEALLAPARGTAPRGIVGHRIELAHHRKRGLCLEKYLYKSTLIR
eukprot:450678-Pleurochrysis_carterae.AAC.4